MNRQNLRRPDVLVAISDAIQRRNGIVTVASLFSGWCSEVMSAEVCLHAWNSQCESWGLVRVNSIRHRFAVAIHRSKRDLIKRRYGKLVDHLIINVEDMAGARAYDDKSQTFVDVPRCVDIV